MRTLLVAAALAMAACGGTADRQWQMELTDLVNVGTSCTGTATASPAPGIQAAGDFTGQCRFPTTTASMIGTMTILESGDVQLEMNAIGDSTITMAARSFYFENAVNGDRIDGDGEGWGGQRWHLTATAAH